MVIFMKKVTVVCMDLKLEELVKWLANNQFQFRVENYIVKKGGD